MLSEAWKLACSIMTMIYFKFSEKEQFEDIHVVYVPSKLKPLSPAIQVIEWKLEKFMPRCYEQIVYR